jgi:hypothetical protein
MWRVVAPMKLKNVIGKYIYFIDRNKAWRISKAISVSGNTITVVDAVGSKERLHPTTNKIFGVIANKKSLAIEEIEYGTIRMGKAIKEKLEKNRIEAMKRKPLRTKRPRAGRPSKVK